MTPPTVAIEYRRLPDRVTTFHQLVVDRTDRCVVTYLPNAGLAKPVRALGRTILEAEAPVVWFTFPGRWYDVGRFHLTDGAFTGIYANVLTPVRMAPGHWRTTDLCLDVWMGARGGVEVLDEEEFRTAQEAGWIGRRTAAKARETAHTIARAARSGRWPPPEVAAWPLERVRRRLDLA